MIVFQCLLEPQKIDFWTNMAPTWLDFGPQVGPQLGLKWDQHRSKNGFGSEVGSKTNSGTIWGRFWDPFCSIWGRFWVLFWFGFGSVLVVFVHFSPQPCVPCGVHVTPLWHHHFRCDFVWFLITCRIPDAVSLCKDDLIFESVSVGICDLFFECPNSQNAWGVRCAVAT